MAALVRELQRKPFDPFRNEPASRGRHVRPAFGLLRGQESTSVWLLQAWRAGLERDFVRASWLELQGDGPDVAMDLADRGLAEEGGGGDPEVQGFTRFGWRG